MLDSLTRQADTLLEKAGFQPNGDVINPLQQKERAATRNGILSEYNLLNDSVIDTNIIYGSFATRNVHQHELSYVIDMRFIENYRSTTMCTGFDWRLYSLIVPRYFLSGYGIWQFQFVPKEGIYLALYKLNDEERTGYKENYLQASKQHGMCKDDLAETKRLYGIDSSMKKYVMGPGNCYVISDKKISKAASKRLVKWFAKYKALVNVNEC